jgi:tetrahydromethanopterin S-methyltransferase subunit F
MPLPREEVDASTTIAVRNAMLDAGLKASEIDGMLSYQSNDSVFSPSVAGDLGIRLNFYMDVFGGGSSNEALIGIAIGVIEAGMCETVVIFRSMNGSVPYSLWISQRHLEL